MIDAGTTYIHPNIKLAKSPTKAVVVPFIQKCNITLTASIITPAHGPNIKEPMSTGISLKSSL